MTFSATRPCFFCPPHPNRIRRRAPGCPRTRPEFRSPSPYRERRIIRPAERHTGGDRLHRLEIDLAVALDREGLTLAPAELIGTISLKPFR
jgi:hypothetical protein